MNIIIVGAGTVGFSLAEHLNTSENHISVIDHDPRLCEELDNKLDVFTVVGVGSSPAVLEQAGIAGADMVIAVTPSDETNLLICNFAMQYEVTSRIARLKSEEYSRPGTRINLQGMGVTHLVEPEKEVVDSILEYIELPGLTQTGSFQGRNVLLRGYRIGTDMPIAGKMLSEVTQLAAPAPMLIVVIIRDGTAIMPFGNEKLLPDDEIIAIMPRESYPSFRNLINRPSSVKLKKAIVSGDTLTAIHLAEALKPFVERVFLVDPDPEHGRDAAAALNGVEVLSGDCTRAELLQEIHVETAEFFIAAGKDAEDNLMSCLLAKAEGAREVIAVSNDDRHAELFHSLGMDHLINPRKITAQKIIESIQVIPIGVHLQLKNIDVEVMRFIAERKSRIIGKSLQKLDRVFRKSVIVGSILRDGYVIIPNGTTVIEQGDEVLVLCRQRNADQVKRLFTGGLPVLV